MRVPAVGPRQLRELAGDGIDAGRRLFSLLPRIEAILDTADGLLEQIARVIVRIEESEATARNVVREVDETHARVRGIADAYTPAVNRLRPLVERLATTWEPADMDRIRQAVVASPKAVRLLSEQVVPVLDAMKSVAPDLQDLVVTSRALNEIIGSVPGLGRAKKRADEQLEADSDG